MYLHKLYRDYLASMSTVVTKCTAMSIIGDPMITCSVNAKVAIENRRPDIARIWETCEHLAREMYSSVDNRFRCSQLNLGLNQTNFPRNNSNNVGLSKLKRHPMISKMLDQIILNLVQGSVLDFQTAAMIICAFTPNRKRPRKTR